MTQNKKRLSLAAILTAGEVFDIELKKTSRGAIMLVSGVLCVSEFSPERVILLSHAGRLTVSGELLSLSSLENRTLEIYGKITCVEFGYGRN